MQTDLDENQFPLMNDEREAKKIVAVTSNPKSHDESPITVLDVDIAIKQQKLGKASGPDGICIEVYKYGDHRLRVYLCILFNLCIASGYLQFSFLQSAVSPLVKSNTGDLTDVNNYRAIAVSNTVSKILESVLGEFIVTHDTDDY